GRSEMERQPVAKRKERANGSALEKHRSNRTCRSCVRPSSIARPIRTKRGRRRGAGPTADSRCRECEAACPLSEQLVRDCSPEFMPHRVHVMPDRDRTAGISVVINEFVVGLKNELFRIE